MPVLWRGNHDPPLKSGMKRFVRFLVAMIALGCSPATPAEVFPSKPIRFVVPYPPGGTPDVIARVMSVEMAKKVGQPVIVENRSGADGMIGYEFVARRAPPDGYTVAIGSVQALAIAPVAVKEIRFDPIRDLLPVIGIAQGRLALVSSATLPWASFNAMVSELKSSPGKYNYGTSSLSVRLATESMLRHYGLDVIPIPFSGDGPARIRAILNAEIHIGLVAEQFAISLGDKVRVLAVTGEGRAMTFPNVPTFAELGLPDLKGLSYSLSAPRATPKEAVATLYSAASQTLQIPTVHSQLERIRMDVVVQAPDLASKQLADEARFFSETAKKLGIKPE